MSWLIASTTVMKGNIPPISDPESAVTSPASAGVTSPARTRSRLAPKTPASSRLESSPRCPSR
ncbi:hypothetical protein [Halalkalicoccus salilacus]|uniref:hypothetical protein n=1 Tax=Halalkalicoccus sp. GCM10025704 TaxID=3252662 RepID=UPI003617C0CC